MLTYSKPKLINFQGNFSEGAHCIDTGSHPGGGCLSGISAGLGIDCETGNTVLADACDTGTDPFADCTNGTQGD